MTEKKVTMWSFAATMAVFCILTVGVLIFAWEPLLDGIDEADRRQREAETRQRWNP